MSYSALCYGIYSTANESIIPVSIDKFQYIIHYYYYFFLNLKVLLLFLKFTSYTVGVTLTLLIIKDLADYVRVASVKSHTIIVRNAECLQFKCNLLNI